MSINARKILVIKPSSFGDIIQANPVIGALKKAFPGCSVTWLAADKWSGALDLFSGLDGRIIWNRDSLKGYFDAVSAVRKARFDAVIDLQGLARSAFMAFLSGAKYVVGVPGMKELSWLLVREPFPESRGMNAARRNLEPVRFMAPGEYKPVFDLSVPPGAEAEAARLLEQHGAAGGGMLIGLVPDVRGRSKQWPLEYYTELSRLIRSEIRDSRILVFGSKSVFKLPEGGTVIDLRGKTTIPVMAALMKRCKAVAGGDTGPVHLAAALGVPVVVMWGGSDAEETAPVSPKATILRKKYECAPCRTKPTCKDYPCLRDIKPEEALEAIKKWIN